MTYVGTILYGQFCTTEATQGSAGRNDGVSISLRGTRLLCAECWSRSYDFEGANRQLGSESARQAESTLPTMRTCQ